MNSIVSDNIMVVGEDSHFCYLMRSYIRRSTHHSLFVLPGDNVVETACREHPTVIIIDVDLPGMSGWKLLRALKLSEATREIPVVVCSWMSEKERGAKEGASVYLRMPILFGDFIEALNSVGIVSNRTEKTS